MEQSRRHSPDLHVDNLQTVRTCQVCGRHIYQSPDIVLSPSFCHCHLTGDSAMNECPGWGCHYHIIIQLVIFTVFVDLR